MSITHPCRSRSSIILVRKLNGALNSAPRMIARSGKSLARSQGLVQAAAFKSRSSPASNSWESRFNKRGG